jgi:osmotically-inducible protein OsmY
MNHDSAHPIDDIDLAAAIAAFMQFDGEPPEVTIGVSEGIVTLEGEVETIQQRDAAESIVRRFNVAGVINAITLRVRPV